MDNLIADSIKNVPHLAAFDELAANRLDGIDISPVLINLIDTVPASALPALAEQFDVLGFKGYKFANTESDKRDLIKRAVELHRYKGTPWAIKESLKSINIMDATILEGIFHFVYNGLYVYDGSASYGEVQWPQFRVLVDASSLSLVNMALYRDIIILVEEYKNVRSHLVDISFKINLNDSSLVSEYFLSNNPIEAELLGTGGTYYSANSIYNGFYKYNKVQDELIINILP